METGTCRWVSVSESEKPQYGERVFTVMNGAVDRWWYENDGFPEVITHWLKIEFPPIPRQKVKKEGWVLPSDIYADPKIPTNRWRKVTYEEDI